MRKVTRDDLRKGGLRPNAGALSHGYDETEDAWEPIRSIGGLLRTVNSRFNPISGEYEVEEVGSEGGAGGDVTVLNWPASSFSSVSTGSVEASISSATLLASNSDRKIASIQNDSTSVLFVKLGSGASASDYTIKMRAGSYYELPLPIYTGVITGIWAAANGSAKVTEVTG